MSTASRTTSEIVVGSCHHDCPDTCGWHVTIDRTGPTPVALQMRGNPDHPYSKGELCPKVNKFLDRVYSDERVLHPLRRVGPKGEGRFEQITWDEALSEIASRFHEIIARDGAEALMPYSDAGNQSVLAMGFPERFWNRVGATRVVRAICGPTVGAGVKMTNGTTKGLDPLEIRHSQLILLWGTNTKLTNRHLWPTIETARKDGAQVVVVDPIRTVTADDADWFIQPLPGTDIALMLAVMHVLIRDGLTDKQWVAEHTLGFDELAAHVASWTPERASAACGVAAADIERLAHMYGTIRPAVIRTLVGAEHHENGAMFFRTLACLPALVGAWKDRGGGLARSVGVWSGSVVDGDVLQRPDLLGGRQPRWVNMSRLAEILSETKDLPIRGLLVWNCNPLVITPNVEKIRAGAMRNDLFTVVHEQFITDTARYADIVLPATTQIEATDVVPPWGHLWLSWNEAAIEPCGEAVSNSELFRRLARAMGYTEPELFDDDMTVIRESLPSIDVDELRRTGTLRVPYPEDGRPFGEGIFPTSSGKVEFVSEALVAMGQPALPTFVPPAEGPGTALAERYPLQLMTPKQHTRFLNGSYSHLPGHGGREQGPFLELCAVDAASRGIVDGQCVRVFNDRASIEVPARISERLRPGVVSIPWGWWSRHHPDGMVANSLTNDTLTEWGGGVAFYDTLVEISAH
ncbi:MAG TPA: molybdopterin-dependent oxidoreductase [Ilumatobacteraceae bacterium]|nr:molybdopterin-dependent oxidoreductase [Ilumatobacteraceae bacterium]